MKLFNLSFSSDQSMLLLGILVFLIFIIICKMASDNQSTNNDTNSITYLPYEQFISTDDVLNNMKDSVNNTSNVLNTMKDSVVNFINDNINLQEQPVEEHQLEQPVEEHQLEQHVEEHQLEQHDEQHVEQPVEQHVEQHVEEQKIPIFSLNSQQLQMMSQEPLITVQEINGYDNEIDYTKFEQTEQPATELVSNFNYIKTFNELESIDLYEDEYAAV